MSSLDGPAETHMLAVRSNLELMTQKGEGVGQYLVYMQGNRKVDATASLVFLHQC